MAKPEKARQIVFTVSDRVGLLADFTGILAQAGLNVLALCAYASGRKATFMLVVDNHRKAAQVLKKNGVKKITYEDVVLVKVQNRPGALNKIADKLAAKKINLKYAYATASGKGAVICVLGVSSIRKAINTLS
jgi:hypothetical protein